MPVSGMALLESHQCRPGETRTVAIRGIEDNYASTGDEPVRMRPALRSIFARYLRNAADFDSRQPDRFLTDWLAAPRNVASALVVVKFRALGDNLNDAISFGQLGPVSHIFSSPPADLAKRPGWSRSGDLHWAEAGQIQVRTGGSLLDLIRSGGAENGVDLQVSDDTSVDFWGVAWCQAPPRDKGVTMEVIDVSGPPVKDLAAFDCRRNDTDGPVCDPFNGDHLCRTELPLLCFRSLSLPTPRDAARYNSRSYQRWSGGEVAATEPLKASRFATIGDADRYCASRFGPDWRVAEWHDGGVGFGFSARSGGRRFSGRYWVDILGAPHGTCWERNHDH